MRRRPVALLMALAAFLTSVAILSVGAPPTSAAAPSVPPPAPTITTPVDGSVLDTATPQVAGTGEPGNTVIVIELGLIVCTATVTPTGAWACVPTSPLAAGGHLLLARQTDAQGASSGSSNNVRVTVEVTATRSPEPTPVVPAPHASPGHVGWVVPLAVAATAAVAIVLMMVLARGGRLRRR